MEILPTLDLFNFTEPIATESQYILTSPRSLEACARFGIKPVELLPKTTEEFEDDYGSFTDKPSVLYKKFEKERLRKLRLCRQERERIIDENAPRDSDDESICDEIFSSGDYDNYCMMDSPRESNNRREKDEAQKTKTKEKPSILDYFDATSSYPIVNAPVIDEESYEKSNGSNVDHSSASPNMTYNALSDPVVFPVHEVTSQKKKKASKTKRSQSYKLKRENSGDDIDDINMTLPKAMKKNLSLMPKKDKKMLDTYRTMPTGQYTDDSSDSPQCWNSDVKSISKSNQKMSYSNSDRKMEREENMNQTQTRNEKTEAELQASKWKTKYKKQLQKMDQKLNSIEKERQFGNEIDSNINSNKWQKQKPPKSPALPRSSIFHDDQKSEKHIREERIAQLNELQEKHKRAGEVFQQRMKQKLQQREFNKMKQQERKDFQERQLQVIEQDLKLWQTELRNYQDICAARATKIVEKRNAITSAKTHDKRHQKEKEHAMLKSRVDEQERLRQEELKALVNIKDTRSKMIISAKEEYANAGREYAQSTRTNKDRVHERNNVHSSFDKMAYKGERMARLEKLSSAKKAAQNSPFGIKQRKNQSILTLG